MPLFRRRLARTLVAAVALWDAGAARADTPANMIDLGYLAADIFYGDRYSVGVAVNDSGLVAGNSTDANGDVQAVLLDHGTVTEIPRIGSAYESEAVDLNEAGDVVGTSGPGTAHARAFLFRGGVLTDLGALPGGISSEAVAINDSGLVAGNSTTATSFARSFVWLDGTMTDLGDLGGNGSRPTAINNAGQVCGYADTATQRHAYRYSGGVMSDLGTLGGSQSAAFAINEAGDVTGGARIAGDSAEHAFRWHDGVMEDLGTLGGSYSAGFLINEAGDIAGSSLITGDTEYHPFLYRNGTMVDMGTPGALQDTAVAINEDGDVLGFTIAAGGATTSSWVYSQGVKRDIGSLTGGSTFASAWNSHGLVTGSSDDSDGNDIAFLTRCPIKPAAGCSAAATGSLSVRDDADDAKDKLLWRWAGSAPLVLSEFGAPDASSDYALCAWDSTGAVDSLVTVAAIAAGNNWIRKDAMGWMFRDETGGDGGVGMVRLGTGGSRAASILVKAGGTALSMPAPYSATELLNAEPRVTVQLSRDGGTRCWGTEFAGAKSSTATKFRAKLP